MDKYNILIGILLLLLILDDKIVEGLTLDVCDKHEQQFKLLDEKINKINNGKNIVINNNLCDEGKIDNIEEEHDEGDGDDDEEEGIYSLMFFNYIPKILIGILVLTILYFIIEYFLLKKKKVTAMTYDEALENVKNAKVLKSKGIKLK